MGNRCDLPIKFISLGFTAFGFYSTAVMFYPNSTNIELAIWALVGMAISYSFTFVGMGNYAKELNTGGIYKLASFIALIYLLNTSTIYTILIDKNIDPRYSTIKKEYAGLPKFDDSKLEELKRKQQSYIDKYNKDIEDSYIKYKKALEKLPRYDYYASLKEERNHMKSWRAKANSKYSLAVKECSGYDLSKGSRSVADCQKDLVVSQLKRAYIQKESLARSENSIYFVDNIPHTHLLEDEVKANSEGTAYKKRKELKEQLLNIESKFVPMWVVGIFVYLFGFFFESRIANMSVFSKYDNLKRSVKDNTITVKTLTKRKSEVVRERLENEKENMSRLLSSNDNMLRFLHSVLFIEDGDYAPQKTLNRLRVKHATFFAVLKSIVAENPTHLGLQKRGFSERIIQEHMPFINPKKKVPFSVKNYHTKVREILEKDKAVLRSDEGWLFDQIALRKSLKKIDKLS